MHKMVGIDFFQSLSICPSDCRGIFWHRDVGNRWSVDANEAFWHILALLFSELHAALSESKCMTCARFFSSGKESMDEYCPRHIQSDKPSVLRLQVTNFSTVLDFGVEVLEECEVLDSKHIETLTQTEVAAESPNGGKSMRAREHARLEEASRGLGHSFVSTKQWFRPIRGMPKGILTSVLSSLYDLHMLYDYHHYIT